jgi:hypothetical protein
MDLFTKIGLGVIAALAILCLILYAGNLKQDKEISTLTAKVSELNNFNDVLKQRIETCQKICKATTETRQEIQNGIDAVRAIERDAIEQIKNTSVINKGDGNDKVDESTVLPDDLVRLLNGHCDKVRGKACANP